MFYVYQESSEQLAMGEAFGIKAPEKKVKHSDKLAASLFIPVPLVSTTIMPQPQPS